MSRLVVAKRDAPPANVVTSVTCPECHVTPGMACQAWGGALRAHWHTARVEAVTVEAMLAAT